MKILLTAFEPFDNLNTNSSLEVLKQINIDNVVKEALPVSYNQVKIKIKELIENHHPDFIINLGQAGGETKLRIEKFAINYTRASIPDNDGILKTKGEVFEGAPLALTSTLDLESIVDEANIDHIDSYISLSAGGYICNSCYFSSLYLNNGNALFIHLPYLLNQVDGKNGVELEILIKNTTYFIEKIIEIIMKTLSFDKN